MKIPSPQLEYQADCKLEQIPSGLHHKFLSRLHGNLLAHPDKHFELSNMIYTSNQHCIQLLKCMKYPEAEWQRRKYSKQRERRYMHISYSLFPFASRSTNYVNKIMQFTIEPTDITNYQLQDKGGFKDFPKKGNVLGNSWRIQAL